MKLRIKGDSIRVRLSKSEVDAFQQHGYIEESTNFGNATLTYALQRTAEGNGLSAGFESNKVTLFMPAADADTWTSTERVGYERNMEIGDGKQLYLLLEKDFKCLDNTNEDQSDMYENPLAEFHK